MGLDPVLTPGYSASYWPLAADHCPLCPAVNNFLITLLIQLVFQQLLCIIRGWFLYSVQCIKSEVVIRKFILALGLCNQVLVAGGLLGWQSPVAVSC